ncbi:hypothetical protein BX661DRAFT_177938 [Kickxella alabastrina]|uniref:uncharacterized protein n=1 Tax=Kickxella alabastrina TaxID=61397 RepID=UPI00221E44EE|nr:uncharacterized protein BX661DRAFT_177938 [Kickxella alabastrina]KAI7833218.1 hypothetical protein BX661DRAFT_177938 [Kickxella alabastrina]
MRLDTAVRRSADACGLVGVEDTAASETLAARLPRPPPSASASGAPSSFPPSLPFARWKNARIADMLLRRRALSSATTRCAAATGGNAGGGVAALGDAGSLGIGTENPRGALAGESTAAATPSLPSSLTLPLLVLPLPALCSESDDHSTPCAALLLFSHLPNKSPVLPPFVRRLPIRRPFSVRRPSHHLWCVCIHSVLSDPINTRTAMLTPSFSHCS